MLWIGIVNPSGTIIPKRGSTHYKIVGTVVSTGAVFSGVSI